MNATRQIVPTSASFTRGVIGPSAVGRALDPDDREFFEDRFGSDFSHVRVHTDAPAATLADAIGANAFAAGDDLAFAPGRYAPGTARGRELLAHELAHVAQQHAGAGATASEEPHARSAARDVVQQGQAGAPGRAPVGIYADDNDKTTPVGPEPLPPLPLTLPPLQLTPPAIDWMKMRDPYTSRGLPFTLQDADSIGAEWQRSSRLLDTLGIDDRFKLWFITKDWLLNKGLSYQLDWINSRDNPNAIDRFNLEWKDAHPSGWQTPMIPIFDLDWFRSSSKKKSP
jgi:hypothetical protein